MSDYIIGDVHGSLSGLICILEKLSLGAGDTVFFIGDLVGKGEDDWGVLDFVDKIPSRQIILGNHDLHFLKTHQAAYRTNKLTEGQQRGYDLLRTASLAKWHAKTDTLMVHAGVWPGWSLAKALAYAAEVEAILKDDALLKDFCEAFYGDEADWDEKRIGWKRVRSIINIFTRMRMLNDSKNMDFAYTGPLVPELPTSDTHAERLTAWFNWQEQWPCKKIVFGHWARLNGQTGRQDIINIDGGFVYGGELLAINCDTGQRYSVKHEEVENTRRSS